jgi:hypothetical protein
LRKGEDPTSPDSSLRSRMTPPAARATSSDCDQEIATEEKKVLAMTLGTWTRMTPFTIFS